MLSQDGVLDYEELVMAYNKSLLTALRGFRAGPDFLETWVPEDDHSRSILNLAESAQMSGARRLALCIGPSVLPSLDLGYLERLLGGLGLVTITVSGDAAMAEVEYV